MSLRVTRPMHQAKVRQLIPTAGGLLDDVIDVGLAIVTLYEHVAELAHAAVAGDHGEPRSSP